MQRILDVVEKVGNKVPHPVVIFLILIGLVIVFSALFGLAGVGVTYEEIVASPGMPTKDRNADPTYPQLANKLPIVQADPDHPGKYRIVDVDPENPSKTRVYTQAEIERQPEGERKYKVVQVNAPSQEGGYALIETRTRKVRSLLTAEGIRFMYVSLIPSFMSFTALGLIIVAMIGVGVAEEAGLVGALIKKLVIVSPRPALTYILAFVGIVSSIAADAGYLVLIPLAGVAFLSVGRHPLAGLALGFAAVAGAFVVNILIKPLDAVLVEFTNDAIHLVDPNKSIGLASNIWFSIASVLFLTVLIGFITDRVISPRLGAYKPDSATGDAPTADDSGALTPEESRGLRYALYAFLGVMVFFGLLTLPAGAPLRDPETGNLIGNTPFMNGLIAAIMMLFLFTGAAYGYGVGKMKNLTDVIKAIEKAMAGLGSLVFLFLVLSQFVAYFNYTNMGSILAVKMANVLIDAGVSNTLLLLLGFIVVVAIIDLLLTGAIAKWAIFAPIFVPLLMKLGVTPEAVLAAYRVADSPANSITPLNAYFALVVGFAQKYDKNAGVGTVVALMLPYVIWMFLLWTVLFAVWHSLGLPWGV
jgi:aminobenzoyl-glutamate transport protein